MANPPANPIPSPPASGSSIRSDASLGEKIGGAIGRAIIGVFVVPITLCYVGGIVSTIFIVIAFAIAFAFVLDFTKSQKPNTLHLATTIFVASGMIWVLKILFWGADWLFGHLVAPHLLVLLNVATALVQILKHKLTEIVHHRLASLGLPFLKK